MPLLSVFVAAVRRAMRRRHRLPAWAEVVRRKAGLPPWPGVRW